jgi:DNA ligase-1
VLNDLRTGVREGVLQAAVAQTFSIGLADVLRGQLLLGDLAEVAVRARAGTLAEAQFALFHPLQFMLASPIESPAAAPGEWIVEDKLDGIRVQIHKQGSRVAMYTRTLDRTDESFPDVVTQIRRCQGDFLIDGEIVPWRNGRALPFAVLQKRLGRKKVSEKQLADMPAVVIAFDLLYANGRLLLDEPLETRQRLLRELAEQSPSLIVLPSARYAHSDEVATAFEKSRTAGNEGLMLKNPLSPYAPGRRGGAWLKLKSHLPTLDCVVTAAEFGHGKRRGSLSDYTFAVWDRDPAEEGAKLVNIAKAYSGVTDVEIAELTQRFLSISLSDNGRVHQVKPQVVMELAFDQILESDRHASGYAMRFPRIKRIRTDKRIEDADRLDRVREIYRSVGNLGQKQEVPLAAAEPTLFD